jgi:hypothetical protein
VGSDPTMCDARLSHRPRPPRHNWRCHRGRGRKAHRNLQRRGPLLRLQVRANLLLTLAAPTTAPSPQGWLRVTRGSGGLGCCQCRCCCLRHGCPEHPRKATATLAAWAAATRRWKQTGPLATLRAAGPRHRARQFRRLTGCQCHPLPRHRIDIGRSLCRAALFDRGAASTAGAFAFAFPFAAAFTRAGPHAFAFALPFAWACATASVEPSAGGGSTSPS